MEDALIRNGLYKVIIMPQQERAPGAPPVAPNPLESAIYELEQKARVYHNELAKNTPADEAQEQKLAREQARKKDWDHLQEQRRKIEVLADLQDKLDKYREDNKSKSRKDLEKEKHHEKRNKVLMDHLTAMCEPKPSKRYDAHHIIPGKGQYQKARTRRARLNLHLYGIGINDPINGVWLPRTKADKGHWATPKAPAHGEIHRFNYETWIADLISLPGLTELNLTSRLREVKTMLRDGGYPDKIVMPKDTEWTAQ